MSIGRMAVDNWGEWQGIKRSCVFLCRCGKDQDNRHCQKQSLQDEKDALRLFHQGNGWLIYILLQRHSTGRNAHIKRNSSRSFFFLIATSSQSFVPCLETSICTAFVLLTHVVIRKARTMSTLEHYSTPLDFTPKYHHHPISGKRAKGGVKTY